MISRARIVLARVCVASFLASASVALVVACTADGLGDALLPESTEAGTEPPLSHPLPSTGDPDDPPADDGGSTDAGEDGSKDAGNDGGKDGGKASPNPGDPCATVDELFKRACGACGTQEALCLSKPDGTPDVVSDYSPCTGELDGGCLPGTIASESCGNCGTRTRTCSPFCAWTTGACAGEPVNGCTPSTQDYTAAGCPVAGTVRTRACADTCTWSTFASTCDVLDFKLVVSGTIGENVSAIYPLRAAVADTRMTGTCPNGIFSTTTTHPYVYVELVNPTALTLTLSAWNTVASDGGPVIDTLMQWYAATAHPTDDASRRACSKGVVDYCPTGLACGAIQWAGLTGASAVTLAPNASALLFFGSYFPAGGSTVAEGNVKLVVHTDNAL